MASLRKILDMSDERLGWKKMFWELNLVLIPIIATALIGFGAWTVKTVNKLEMMDEKLIRSDLETRQELKEWVSDHYPPAALTKEIDHLTKVAIPDLQKAINELKVELAKSQNRN